MKRVVGMGAGLGDFRDRTGAAAELCRKDPPVSLMHQGKMEPARGRVLQQVQRRRDRVGGKDGATNMLKNHKRAHPADSGRDFPNKTV